MICTLLKSWWDHWPKQTHHKQILKKNRQNQYLQANKTLASICNFFASPKHNFRHPNQLRISSSPRKTGMSTSSKFALGFDSRVFLLTRLGNRRKKLRYKMDECDHILCFLGALNPILVYVFTHHV